MHRLKYIEDSFKGLAIGFILTGSVAIILKRNFEGISLVLFGTGLSLLGFSIAYIRDILEERGGKV